MAALLVPGAGWANEPPCCRDCGEIHVSEGDFGGSLAQPAPGTRSAAMIWYYCVWQAAGAAKIVCCCRAALQAMSNDSCATCEIY